jgi:hypothetical protein
MEEWGFRVLMTDRLVVGQIVMRPFVLDTLTAICFA